MSVFPSTKYRDSSVECEMSLATTRGWLKNTCSHSELVTRCFFQFFV
jgi:hypothetical protein